MFPSIETPRQVVADFRAAALSSGRYDLMSNEYTYPLTVYLNETPHVLDTAKQAWGFFQGFHAVLRSEGLDRMTAKIAAEGLPRGGRFRIWTDWFAHHSLGRHRHQYDRIHPAQPAHAERLTDPAGLRSGDARHAQA
jgi:hypothetical protein